MNLPALPPRHRATLAAAAVAALLLAGCGSAPTRPGPGPGPVASPPGDPAPRPARAPRPPPPADTGADGPEANPPPDLHLVPDAQPRVEPLRPGGPNKPYEVLGQAYAPLQGDVPLVERGLASWYGRKFHGRSTANGETYNMYAMSAAHKTMPLPSYARVRNPANGREVVVRINDRGPFHPGRVIDLSYTAALKLGVLGGVAPVEVERLTHEAIRSGAWKPAAPVVETTALAPALRAEPPPGRTPARPAASTLDDPIGDLLQRTTAAAQAAEARSTVSGAPLPAETAAPAQPAAKAARGFWLQLGAFALRDGAMDFQQRVATEAPWLAPLLAVFNERSLHRLQAGPYASRAEAQVAAQRLRDGLQLVPAIVERR
ncbi:septal ring lytic transglycosylase RlpA family protein [Pseudaquabacterium pictum]|uniref:Endolytic peptidoglycan transglycosylase RlpA n=1 Tax=Pseudaquabacterium pictum TaxID=2315236 RepID=A0A480AZ88_9BURK|nr:septal ring lytic transglycosylase RlpA family protein [Rubrivivax pictus]GCL66246.1 lipoprotein [Rubrivivax pictus]